ncbi:hypothetical protein PQR66_16660 [Paraburkholderia agricolaris]|uniref:Uncharacterized protein n=1 Tax=Paraburkholderia agricolaris TaxID=2152888 RepID=A0ABW8ZN64_9BURK
MRPPIHNLLRAFLSVTLLFDVAGVSAADIDCTSVQEKLKIGRWKNFKQNIMSDFVRTGPLTGRRTAYTNHGTITINYELKTTNLVLDQKPIGRSVCEFTEFYPAGGQCAGDVMGYFVSSVGPELVFSTKISMLYNGNYNFWGADANVNACGEGYVDFSLGPVNPN